MPARQKHSLRATIRCKHLHKLDAAEDTNNTTTYCSRTLDGSNLACSILIQQMLESVVTATAGLPRHLEGSPQQPPCTLSEALSYCAHEPPTQQSTIIFRRPHSSHNNLDCMSSITGPCHNCLATASAQSVQHVKAQMSCNKTCSCFCSMMPNSLYACQCSVNLCEAWTATSSKGASCVYTTNTCPYPLAHGVRTTGPFQYQ